MLRQTRWQLPQPPGPNGEAQRLAVSGNLLAPGGAVLAQGAKAGLGIAMLGRWMVSNDPASATLQQVLPDWQAAIHEESAGGIYLLYKDERYQRPALRALIDYPVEHLAC